MALTLSRPPSRLTATEVAVIDGNEAVARVAYALSEVIAIYPITPASPMAERCDEWAARGVPNRFGDVPEVVEMQSEAGAAGTLHGAVQAGALSTSFTASQGLLLMVPDMFKVAGELSPAVLHVAARAVATHALSIFGDHSDVMATRSTGWAMLASASVQEAHDLALVAHAATLRSRLPFLHFFDGFRTSHEVNEVQLLPPAVLAELVGDGLVRAHRERALDPERPVVRGTAHNPDTFFQAREAASPFVAATPGVVRSVMEHLGALTGRRYDLVAYHGHPRAERVVVLMGSAVAAARAAVDHLVAAGERVGVLQVRLFRPFPSTDVVAALPPSVERVVVMDRTKEPGAAGEPLLQDVLTALADAATGGPGAGTGPASLPLVIGARYGLSSKEVTPSMVAAVLDELARPEPRRRLTVGIVDDVSGTSVRSDPRRVPEPTGVGRAVFVGLGSDGTVGAVRSTARNVPTRSPHHTQAYFEYDSKKSGSVTVSHLRWGPEPIDAPWLVRDATYLGVHHLHLLERRDLLDLAAPGATVVLNSRHGQGTWEQLPREAQEQVLGRQLDVWVVDADRLTREAGLTNQVSTVMLTCFHHLAGLVPPERAGELVKDGIHALYATLGDDVLAANDAAVDAAAAGLERLEVAGRAPTSPPRPPLVPGDAPAFVRQVTAALLAGKGDALPVSAFPPDGTWPTGTARFERRHLAAELPVWDPELCIDCGKCAVVCPHAAVRLGAYEPTLLEAAPAGFPSKPVKDRAHLGDLALTVAVAPDDCTGCGLCVEVCPAHDRTHREHKALVMAPAPADPEPAREVWRFFRELPQRAPEGADPHTVKGSQLRPPLFEFSGACAGCGETPYLSLLTRLFGDRLLVANATGCSSIYGGNLPTTPWSVGPDGRGPAWSNSLFEDNAEFGLGMRLALDRRRAAAERLLRACAPRVGDDLVTALLEADQEDDRGVAEQRERVAELRRRLAHHHDAEVEALVEVAADLVDRSVWIVGGDGWAYDIGFGGVDHVLASGRDVNLLVLDTEGYSNTGGQASKSTSRGALAKFASAGKPARKKDLGMIAAAYGNVYVAQVALGANDLQAVRALHEAETWPGPSLVLAYSHCIAHGIDMRHGMEHQHDAVRTGYWPLFRYDPRHAERGDHPFRLDSRPPSMDFARLVEEEGRFAALQHPDPADRRATRLAALAEHDLAERWNLYEQMGELERWGDDEVGDGDPA